MPPTPVFRTALNYGAISGISSFAFFVILYILGASPLGPASWLGAWIPVLFMIMATRQYRDHENGGFISYWTAYRAGFLTAACGAFLFALLLYVFGKVIVPDFLSDYLAESLEAIEQSRKLTEDMFGENIYDEAVRNLEKMTLSRVAAQEFFSKSFGGLLVAFLTAAVLQKKPDHPFEDGIPS